MARNLWPRIYRGDGACEARQGVDGLVIHGVSGMLAKPNDIDSIFESLDFLLSYPEKAKDIGIQARDLILENYTYKKNAERTMSVYNELLNKGF